MPARLNFVELPATATAPMKTFYASAFGFAMTDFGPTYACTLSGDVDLGLQADASERTRAPLLVIQVEHLEATEAAVRRAEERVLVDRVMWLASASPNSQVRATATLRLSKLSVRLRASETKTEADNAQRMHIAADIKRFLERPMDVNRPIPIAAPGAPPGAPIGDAGMDWLSRPRY